MGCTVARETYYIFTYNQPITEIWNSGTTPSVPIMSLIRKTYLIAARLEFSISLKQVLGIYNPIADALFHFQMQKFYHFAPHANVNETILPPAVWNLLLSTMHTIIHTINSGYFDQPQL